MAKSKAKKAPAPTTVETPAQRAFLASILADPDDKKARLVYADLLSQTDDPRGAFIVMQCTRADLTDGDPRIAELDAQIEALLKKHKKAWTAHGDNKGARWEFRRGFVEKLSLDAKDLVANGAQIFAAEPIEELSVWKIDESPSKVGKSRLAPVLALPLDRIRRLSLARCELTEDDFAALASAKTLGSVEVLDLTKGTGDTAPIAPLAKATSLPRLRELKLRGCRIGDEGMATLAKSKTLRFSRLDAAMNDLTATACEAIADATWAPQLVHLDLSSNEMIGDAGLRALADSTKLTALRSLKLEYVGLYEEAADIILASPALAKLEHLDVSANMSGEDHARIKAVFGDRLR
jgi:uncharacterized protein (TIGR02996 family)